MQYCCPNNLGCIFWGDYSGVRIDRLSSLCVFLGLILFILLSIVEQTK